MSNLREKLAQIDSTLTRHKQVEQQPVSEVDSTNTFEGQTIETPFGHCFVTKQIFPNTHRHGNLRLVDLLNKSGHQLSLAAKQKNFENVNPRRLLFVDTETTGLAGGTGTYVFLTGMGYFEDDHFCISQFLMRDFREERAVLHSINALSSDFEGIVSYNGKAFDFSLIRTRCILARVENHLDSLPHLDLLHTTRRLWHKHLHECTLSAAEREMFGFKRSSDVPGFLIPSIYFDYLRSGRVQVLQNVLRHNLFDVLSLVGLTTLACEAFIDDAEPKSKPADPHGVIRTYEHLDRLDRALEICERQIVESESVDEAVRFQIKRAFFYKKQRRWNDAAQAFQKAIQGGCFRMDAYIELAKIYEHRKRDFNAALNIINEALAGLSVIAEIDEQSKTEDYRQDLMYRKERILQKKRNQDANLNGGN